MPTKREELARGEPEPSNDTVIETDGGTKTLTLLSKETAKDDAAAGAWAAPRYTFRAFMGTPEDVRQLDLDVSYESIRVIALSVGNPQCIVLTDRLDEAMFRKLGPELAVHEAFPDGTNVEFVEVERPDRIRILIWERGVGPTTASGTGACASAVAAAAHGGAARSMDVVSSGGSQHVEWKDDGIYLTGVGRDHRTRYVARVLILHPRHAGVGFAYSVGPLVRVTTSAVRSRPGLPVVR